MATPLMYVPNDNRFQNQMFNLLSNVITQKIAYQNQKDLMEERQDFLSQQQTEQQRQAAQMAGYTPMSQEESNWQQTGQVKPDLTIGNQGYKAPQYSFDIVNKDGRLFAVEKKNNKMVSARPLALERGDKMPSDVQEYEYAVQQGFKGSFVDYQTRMKKSGAAQINIGQKVAQTEAIEQAKDKVASQTYIKSPKFVDDAVRAAKEKMGANWQWAENYQKEEAIFDEADRRIKEAYPTETLVFGERGGKRGWFNQKGQLVRPYEGIPLSPTMPEQPSWQYGPVNKKMK
jgi:hypothetical protein